jgi:hypothetical protein
VLRVLHRAQLLSARLLGLHSPTRHFLWRSGARVCWVRERESVWGGSRFISVHLTGISAIHLPVQRGLPAPAPCRLHSSTEPGRLLFFRACRMLRLHNRAKLLRARLLGLHSPQSHSLWYYAASLLWVRKRLAVYCVSGDDASSTVCSQGRSSQDLFVP